MGVEGEDDCSGFEESMERADEEIHVGEQRATPRASDLEYVEGGDMNVVSSLGGRSTMYDEGSAWVSCDSEAFIDNIEDYQ